MKQESLEMFLECCLATTITNVNCLIGGVIKRCFCLTSVCLSFVAYIGPKSRTERPRKTKIGTLDSDTTFNCPNVKVTRPLYSARP